MSAKRLRLRQAVIVEGKYDKIKLESILDALIIPTDGFRIFKNADMRALIRSLAATCGIIVLTDSDRAGFLIRGHLSGITQPGQVTHVYIPDVAGKERRKSHASKEGKLGVEGIDVATLREAFARAGILEDGEVQKNCCITKMRLYEDGLSGGADSKRRRQALLKRLGLPEHLAPNALPELLSRMLTEQQYLETLQALDLDEEQAEA